MSNRVAIRVDARDKNYLPLTDGRLEATVIGPENTNDKIDASTGSGDTRCLYDGVCRSPPGIVCRRNDRLSGV